MRIPFNRMLRSLFLALFFTQIVVLTENVVWARVFRMADETVATYFGGSYGPSLLKQSHFSGTSGTGADLVNHFYLIMEQSLVYYSVDQNWVFVSELSLLCQVR